MENEKPKNDPMRVMSEIVEGWRRRIAASESNQHRRQFMETAKMCNHFYAGSMGLMWEDKFRRDFLNDMPAPRFKITIAKAFEMVAIMGPSVMWDYPGRVVKSRPRKQLHRLVFGAEDDEAADVAYAEYLKRHEAAIVLEDTRNALMESYLNYSQREQPCTLVAESHKAVIEAIVKGRGCLQVGSYKFPGSDRTLTQSEWFSVNDLFLDPDCRRADLKDCYWIARRHRTPYFILEKMFNLPKGSLKDKGSLESLNSTAADSRPSSQSERNAGKTNDIIEWYEVYSRMGVGIHELSGREDLQETFNEIAGDYVYMAICKGVEYPLNLPPKVMRKSVDEAGEALAWPIPYWKDGRWPFAFFDIYERPECPWPLAPMAMGLGPLIFLNIVISALCERVHESCRTLGVVSKSLGDDIIGKLKNFSFSGFAEVPSEVVENLKGLLGYIETPQLKSDIFVLIDLVSDMFERSTGLVDLMYGANAGGKVDRSAADSNNKREAVSVRPEWMVRRAEDWQTEVANLERIAAGWTVKGDDIRELLGEEGSSLWDNLIANEDPEVYVRQMRSTVEANSIKKPNKFRDNQNIQQTIGYVFPVLKDHWARTGDAGPVNNYIRGMAEAMEQPPENWLLPEMPPPGSSPDEQEAQQAAQQSQEIEMAAKQENLRGKQLRNSKLEMEINPAPVMPQLAEQAMPDQMAQDPMSLAM